MNPLDRLLNFFALREGRRVDGFNLAANPARSLLPHRLFAGLLAAAVLLTTVGMVKRWQQMQSEDPPTGSQIALLQQNLQVATAGAEQLRASFNPEEAKQLGNNVREANFLIALRALRPSEQLADLEAVKPFAVRFSGLQRKLDRNGTVEFNFRLIASERGGFETLRDRIARSHRFTELQLHSEMLTPNGYEALLSVDWAPVGAPEKTELPPAPTPAHAPGLQPAVKAGNPAAPPVHAVTHTVAPASRLSPTPASAAAARAPRLPPSAPAAAPFYAPKPPYGRPADPQPPAMRGPAARDPLARPTDPRSLPPPPPAGDGDRQ